MAYYDPGKQDNYYNPEQHSNSEGEGLGAAVKSFALNAVGYMALNAVVGSALRFTKGKVSSAVAKHIQKRPSGFTARNSARYSRLKQDLSIRYKKATKPFRTALKDRQQHIAYTKRHDRFLGNISRVSSVFKDPVTFTSVAANQIVKHGIRGSVVGYAYDHMAGYMPQYGLEEKKWYNIPGHVSNYGKYMAQNGLMFTAFGSLGGIFEGAKGMLGASLRGGLDANKGFAKTLMAGLSRLSPAKFGIQSRYKSLSSSSSGFKQEVIQFQNKVQASFIRKNINRVKGAVGATTQVAIKNARTFFTETLGHARNFANAPRNTGGGLGFVKRHLKSVMNDAKEIMAAKKYDASIMTPAKHTMEGTSLVDTFVKLGKTMTANGKGQGSGGSELLKAIANHNSVMKPQSFIADVMRLKPMKVGDVYKSEFISDVAGRVAPLFPSKNTKHLKDAISNSFMGKHIYADSKGRFAADLSFMSPTAVLRRLGNKLANVNLSMLVGLPPMGRQLSFGSITGLHSMLGQTPSAAFFDKSALGQGHIAFTKDGPKQLKQVMADAFGANHVESNNMSVALIGRKFYGMDGVNLKKLDTYDSLLGFSNPNLKGGGVGEGKKVNLNNFLYHDNKRNKDLYAINQLIKTQDNGNWFARFSNKYDFDHSAAKNIWSKVKRILSPGRVLSNGKQLDHTQELYARTAEGMMGKDLSHEALTHHIPYMNALLGETAQGYAGMLKRPEVFNHIARDSSRLSNYGKTFMHSDKAFVEILENEMATAGLTDGVNNIYDTLTRTPELKSLFNMTIHSPQKARHHIIKQRLGRRSDMTAIDAMRVEFIDANLNLSYRSGGEPHPLLTSSKALYEKGLISKRESTEMKLHGFLSTVYRDAKVDSFPDLIDPGTTKLFKAVRDREAKAHNLSLQDMIEYVGDNKFKNPDVNRNVYQSLKGLYHDPDVLANGVANTYDYSPYFTIGIKPGSNAGMAVAGKALEIGTNRLVNLIGDATGFKKNPFKYGDGIAGSARFIKDRTLQVAKLGIAYKVLDSALAATPFLDDTGLDAGLTGFIADNVARTHLLSSRMANFAGIAGTGRYLEGLMPGFTSSAPGAVIGGALNWRRGVMSTLTGAAGGALVNRIISPLLPDMTKRYEQLEAEYSGEEQVPIIEGQMWFLGTTPWQGNKVAGYQPNWYVRAKSRWEASDSLYGSEMRKLLHEPIFPLGVSVGDFVDPYYMERKHFFSRPYPETSELGKELPMGLGPVIGGTIGRLIKPKKIMHKEFLEGEGGGWIGKDPEVSSIPAPDYSDQRAMMRSGTFNPRKFAARSSFMGTFSYRGTRTYGQNIADKTLDDLESSLGLLGFMNHTIRGSLTNSDDLVMPTLETAGRIASQSRSYYDMNLGGLGIYSEVLRRFVSKPDWKRHGINPIPNLLPNWLPEHMLTGDPYSKITRGELRLPGPAYDQTHGDLEKTMPARASMLGQNVETIVQYFTGLLPPNSKESMDILDTGTQFHEGIQQWLASENILISAENLFYDDKQDISGHIDGIIRDGQGGGGRRALEIKTISKAGLEKLSGPKHEHTSQLNFYLKQAKMQKGTILYVNRDNPSEFKVFEINYNPDRYARDIEKLNKARSIAAQMLADGQEGDGYGYSYSWLDRLYILADVAPTSKEFKEAKQIVQTQIKNGSLNQKQISKYERALKHRKATMRKYELYPTRFKGQILSPDAQVQIESLNDEIKAGAEYSLPERTIGAFWESITNLNIPVINKFMAFKDPLEHYKQYKLYGKEYTPWTDPYDSFIAPAGRNMLAQESALGGALNWGTGYAYMLGGRSGGIYGAIAGGIYGAAHGAVRRITNSARMPEHIEKERVVNEYFDQLKYDRNIRMSQLSEGLESTRYRNIAHNTLTGILQGESGSYTDLFRAAGNSERSYLGAWLNERDRDKRQDILRFIPNDLGNALKSFWQQNDSKENNDAFNTFMSNPSEKKHMSYSEQELDPAVHLEDIKLKTVREEGLNEHDFGLGWQSQLLRTQHNLGAINASNIYEDEDVQRPAIDVSAIRSAIYALLNKLGLQGRVRLFANNHGDNNNKLTITLQRDRLTNLRDAVDFREKYYE